MKIYAFDVDDTLEVSGGPVAIKSVDDLRPQGDIVGLNGNWAVVVQTVPSWHRIFSFIGPMEMSKEIFLKQLKTYIRADDYIMVGNIKGLVDRPTIREQPVSPDGGLSKKATLLQENVRVPVDVRLNFFSRVEVTFRTEA